jgi:polysaccharide biosynthesis protein PelF
MKKQMADVCLIVEGAYPYVNGGVSSWVHELMSALRPLTFHVVALKADECYKPARFALPENVLSLTELVLQPTEHKLSQNKDAAGLIEQLEGPLQSLLQKGNGRDFRQLMNALGDYQAIADCAVLLNSAAAFDMLQRMYDSTVAESSFLQYFWSWRSLVGGLFSVLFADLPSAKVYHSVSTGYAGLLMARAVAETGRPGLVTEHGIYTNERRIEIAMADWLSDRCKPSLELVKNRRDLRSFWLNAFIGYSRTCYDLSSRIVTLYRGNQAMQLRDGASPEKLNLIPNGVDLAAFSGIARELHPFRRTVALIGRVVQIKDVKTFIRAVALVRKKVPQLQALVIGPTDEEPQYFRECKEMVAHLNLEACLQFTGQVRIADYLGALEVVVLTSISEAQPLALLEAGAVGIPIVATDVGACRDIVEGMPDERPALGAGGIVTPLANPQATALAVMEILLDPDTAAKYGQVMRQRTRLCYSKEQTLQSYRALYGEYIALPDLHLAIEEEA